MAAKQSVRQRWENYQASKTMLFWSCAVCVVGTVIVGFAWGGWVTGGTAGEMVRKADRGARAELAAAICVDRFENGPDAAARLTALKGSESWKRDEFIEKGGWVTLAGIDKPVTGAADLCAQRLLEVKLPPAKTAGTSG
jgi:hypothetical protein